MPENNTTKQPRRENPPPISPPSRLTTYIGTPPFPVTTAPSAASPTSRSTGPPTPSPAPPKSHPKISPAWSRRRPRKSASDNTPRVMPAPLPGHRWRAGDVAYRQARLTGSHTPAAVAGSPPRMGSSSVTTAPRDSHRNSPRCLRSISCALCSAVSFDFANLEEDFSASKNSSDSAHRANSSYENPDASSFLIIATSPVLSSTHTQCIQTRYIRT